MTTILTDGWIAPDRIRQRWQPTGAFSRPRYWPGGAFSRPWLVIVMVPLSWIVVSSLTSQSKYYQSNPSASLTHPALDSYRLLVENDFVLHFNSAIVVGLMIPSLIMLFMAAIVRSGRTDFFLRVTNGLFLMGLAIPVQAIVIPVHLIFKLHFYNRLCRADPASDRPRRPPCWCWCC